MQKSIDEAVKEAVKNIEGIENDVPKLDVPTVTDYVKNEQAYIYPSGMVSTKNLDWHRYKQIDQFSMFNDGFIYGEERIIKIKTTNSGQNQKNRFYLRNISDKTDIETVNSIVNVWEPPVNPDTIKNVLILNQYIFYWI